METTERPRRNQDTTAATQANVRRKHERWAAEMREAGWIVYAAVPESMESVMESALDRSEADSERRSHRRGTANAR